MDRRQRRCRHPPRRHQRLLDVGVRCRAADEGGIGMMALTQPWATLLAIGAKRWETRSWPSNFRGTFAIHAAKGFHADDRRIATDDPFFIEALKGLPYMYPFDVAGRI